MRRTKIWLASMYMVFPSIALSDHTRPKQGFVEVGLGLVPIGQISRPEWRASGVGGTASLGLGWNFSSQFAVRGELGVESIDASLSAMEIEVNRHINLRFLRSEIAGSFFVLPRWEIGAGLGLLGARVMSEQSTSTSKLGGFVSATLGYRWWWNADWSMSWKLRGTAGEVGDSQDSQPSWSATTFSICLAGTHWFGGAQ